MKLCIQTFSLRSLSPLDALRAIVGLGILRVEPHWPHNEMTAELARHMTVIGEPLAVAHGVPCVQLDYVKTREAMTVPVMLGVNVVNVDVENGALPLLSRVAREYDFKVAVHPHGPNHRIPGWRAVQQMAEVSDPRVGLCLDTGHIHRAGEDIVEAAAAMGPRTWSIHLKDVDKHGCDVPLGEGILDLPAMFAELRLHGFDGPVAIEWEGDESDPVPGLRLGVEYARKVCGL